MMSRLELDLSLPLLLGVAPVVVHDLPLPDGETGTVVGTGEEP